MIALIDYEAGNLRSVKRALEVAGGDVVITQDPGVVDTASAVVLPGVGHAGHCIGRLRARGMESAIHRAVDAGKPFLGLCVGMQLMFGHQEEGNTTGLGLLRGHVRLLQGADKVPHMGWNRAEIVRDGPAGNTGEAPYFYFVHSYVAADADPADVVAVTNYGERFPSIVVHNNIWGAQFHPEKSADAGLAFMQRFVSFVKSREHAGVKAAS